MMIVVRAYEGAEGIADRLRHPRQLSLVPRTQLTDLRYMFTNDKQDDVEMVRQFRLLYIRACLIFVQ